MLLSANGKKDDKQNIQGNTMQFSSMQVHQPSEHRNCTKLLKFARDSLQPLLASMSGLRYRAHLTNSFSH
jgi:hypothetical protein